MDSRDAHHRHTLRGALIHFNAHTEKRPDADTQESVKKANFLRKLAHIFTASAARCHAQHPCGEKTHIVIEGALRYCVSVSRSDSQRENTCYNMAHSSGRNKLDVPNETREIACPHQQLLPSASPTSADFQ